MEIENKYKYKYIDCGLWLCGELSWRSLKTARRESCVWDVVIVMKHDLTEAWHSKKENV